MTVSKSQFKRIATQQGVPENEITRAIFNIDNTKSNLSRAEDELLDAEKNMERARNSFSWAEKELEDLMK